MTAAASQCETNKDLVLLYYPMVRAIACRIHRRLPKAVDVDDLIGAGVVGLIEALERFDPDRGIPFESYAKHRIRGAVVDALRAADWVPRSVRRKADLLDQTRQQLRDELGRRPTRNEMADALEIEPEKLDVLASKAE
ncbi:MAG: sigma-70 family RNA polymerase sigma factor, partial [Proteobacteria bacterium]|nr:sigma-70 family RNA polymerase sigma factor [Pseudomonadota bacterium]